MFMEANSQFLKDFFFFTMPEYSFIRYVYFFVSVGDFPSNASTHVLDYCSVDIRTVMGQVVSVSATVSYGDAQGINC